MLLMATRAFFQSRAFFQRLYDFPPRLKLAAAPLPRSPGRQLSILASAPMTIMLFACGHGYRAPDGKLYLLVAESDQTQLEATSLSRDEPAQAFGETRARIIVFIAPVTRGLCPTAAATTRSQTRSMRIRCARRRRGQGTARELRESRLRRRRLHQCDRQGDHRSQTQQHRYHQNGVIELSELYSRIKPAALTQMRGQQSPGLPRADTVGEIPLL
jgi:hypothetical protein